MPRKTHGDLPKEKNETSNFKFKIIVGNDNYFYMKVKSDERNVTQHTNHVHIPKSERKHMVQHLKQCGLKLITDCDKAGFSTQMTSALLYASTSKKFLPAQLSYVLSKKSLSILQNDNKDSKLSSASKLLGYLEA